MWCAAGPWLAPPFFHRLLEGGGAGEGEAAWARLDLAVRGLLAAALVVAALVLWGNHGRRRRRGPPEPAAGESDGAAAAALGREGDGAAGVSARRLMDTLALLAVASGLLGALAPEQALSVPPVPGNGQRNDLYDIRTVPIGAAVALVLLAVAGMAAEAFFIWGLLLHARQLRRGGPAPGWWRWAAHAYVWLLYIAPNIVQHVPTQVMLRRQGFLGVFMDDDPGSVRFVASTIMAGFTLLVPAFLRGGLLFRAGLNYVVEPEPIAADPAALRAWHRHALQTALYLALSLGVNVYLWFSLMLYPTNYYVHATIIPFLLLLLLAVSFCFGALPAWWRWRAFNVQQSQQQGGGEEQKDGGDVDTPSVLRRQEADSGGDDGGAAAGRGGGGGGDGNKKGK